MATTATAQEGLTHRVPAATEDVDDYVSRDSASRKLAATAAAGRGKRGLWSLAVAVALSAALTALSFFLAGSPPGARATTVAMVRAGAVAAEAVLAVAAWVAWAEGGMHARPHATLAPFAAQLAAALAWAPLALGRGAGWAGLACCAAMAAAAAGCVRGFGGVNPVAGDLAKPGVAWALLLAVVNYKML